MDQFQDVYRIYCEDPSPRRGTFIYALDSSYQEGLGTIPIVKEFRNIFEEVKSLPSTSGNRISY